LIENKDPHLSDVERYFNTYKVDNTLHAASLFYHIFKTAPQVFSERPSMITPCVELDTHTYQCVNGLVSEDGKPTMRAIWPGYTDSAFSPASSYNNDAACVKGRIIDVKNKRPNIPPSYYTYLSEFVERVVPVNKRHTLSPLSYEDIWEQFNRPTQRALLAQADYNMDVHVSVKSFQKREAYPKVTAPRNISTLPMAHNATLGQYTLPLLTHILKQCHWYAFGRHPRQFSDILHQKAQTSQYATASDFNKLDGSIRGFFRDLFIAICTSAFEFKYHDEIIKIEARERTAKATTTHGYRYMADSTILSGSSMTSVLGTLTNAFIMYAAYRTGYDAPDAWDRLGLYGGDDGVSFDLPPIWIEKTSGKLGLLCTSETSRCGEPVKFLGRLFIDPWTSAQSVADVQRQMKKLHLTASPKIVPDWLVLYRKAIGLKITDPHTPLLTDWCDAVIRITKSLDPEKHKYWHLTKMDQTYWSHYSTPYYTPSDTQYLSGLIATSLNLTVTELYVIIRRLKTATRLEDLYFKITSTNPSITIDATIRGETRRADKQQDVQKLIRQNAAHKILKPCRFVEKGQACPYPKCKFEHNSTATTKATAKPVKTQQKHTATKQTAKVTATPSKVPQAKQHKKPVAKRVVKTPKV